VVMMRLRGVGGGVLGWVALGVLGAASMGFAADKGVRCATAKLTAASKYAACRLKADAKATKTGGNPDYSKCATKFLKAFDRAEAKAGSGVCPGEGNAPAVGSCLDRITTECSTLVAGCDGTGDCGDCGACAQADGGPCIDAVNACSDDPECFAFIECINGCGDQACFDQCLATYPNGSQLYVQLYVCVICDTCPTDCDAANAGCP
jgi:hypothetical protein